jgi:hypothetical protein
MKPLLVVSEKDKPVWTRWARFDHNQIFSISKNVSPGNAIRKNKFLLNLFGNKLGVYLDSSRFKTLSRRQNCYACGLQGTHLFLETNHSANKENSSIFYGACAFNFYAIVDGRLVLMTEDHVAPQSLEKSKKSEFLEKFFEINKECDIDRNYETCTMCIFCNTAKRNNCVDIPEIKKKSKEEREKRLKASAHEWITNTSESAEFVDFWSVFCEKLPNIDKKTEKMMRRKELLSI